MAEEDCSLTVLYAVSAILTFLVALSEILGMSKCKSNSIIEFCLARCLGRNGDQ